MQALKTEKWDLQQEDKMEAWKIKNLGFSTLLRSFTSKQKKLYILCKAMSSSKLHSCHAKSIIIFILLIPVVEHDFLF